MGEAFITSRGVGAQIVVNPNLLDNWYFVGGGSQQGGSQFPINQRGQTSYSSSWAYCLDRWFAPEIAYPLTINSDSVSFHVLDQFTDAILPSGKYTASVLLADGNLYSGTADYSVGSIVVPITGNGTIDVYIVSESATAGHPRIRFQSVSGAAVSVVAVKLELGSQQTLAHQENGVWVLNEIPDFGEQLARCQRYFVRLGRANVPVGFGFVDDGVASAAINIPLPVPMAKIPVLTYDNVYIRVGTTQVLTTSCSVVSIYGSSVVVRFVATYTNYAYAPCAAIATSVVDLSADL